MTDQIRALTTEELEHVGGGFEAVEHTQMEDTKQLSQQFSIMMQTADTVIRGISP